MTRCKRRLVIAETPGAVAGVDVRLRLETAALTLRVVDAAGVPIPFTIAPSEDPTQTLHFTAGEGWAEERLALDAEVLLSVVSAAGSIIELLIWEG